MVATILGVILGVIMAIVGIILDNKYTITIRRK
jgi:hypothetical protein